MLLTKDELEDTFDRFHRIQTMEFHQERMMRNWSDPAEGVGIGVVGTSRPKLIVFAYDSNVSDKAIAGAYERARRRYDLRANEGNRRCTDEPAGWTVLVEPKEEAPDRLAGQVLALFLFQCFLLALYAQNKGQGFYVKYLRGRSVTSEIASLTGALAHM